jgi:hypothetical protein
MAIQNNPNIRQNSNTWQLKSDPKPVDPNDGKSILPPPPGTTPQPKTITGQAVGVFDAPALPKFDTSVDNPRGNDKPDVPPEPPVNY